MIVAAFSYSTGNLGDDIQTLGALCATGICPDLYIDRDGADNTYPEEELVVLGSAYLAFRENPYPQQLRMIYHAISCWPGLSTAWYHHLKDNEPVGCRDIATVKRLEAHAINTYTSLCSTLSFPRYKGRRNGVYLVDVHEKYMPFIPKSLRASSTKLSHQLDDGTGRTHIPNTAHLCAGQPNKTRTKKELQSRPSNAVPERFERAQSLLNTYRSAELVITGRFHCALPCLAFRTPFVYLHGRTKDFRWTGYDQFLTVYNPLKGDKPNWKPEAPDIEKEVEQHINKYHNRCKKVGLHV